MIGMSQCLSSGTFWLSLKEGEKKSVAPVSERKTGLTAFWGAGSGWVGLNDDGAISECLSRRESRKWRKRARRRFSIRINKISPNKKKYHFFSYKSSTTLLYFWVRSTNNWGRGRFYNDPEIPTRATLLPSKWWIKPTKTPPDASPMSQCPGIMPHVIQVKGQEFGEVNLQLKGERQCRKVTPLFCPFPLATVTITSWWCVSHNGNWSNPQRLEGTPWCKRAICPWRCA